MSRKISHEWRRLRAGEWTRADWLRLVWTMLFAGLVAFFVCIAVVIAFLIMISRDLPTTEELINYRGVESTKIYDRHGSLLYEIHGDQRRTNVDLDDMSPYIAKATMAAEDDEFYLHPGFDWKGIVRAGLADVASLFGSNQQVQGASTLTQQFVRNAYLSREKTITRKAKELLLALQVEKHFTKDEILEMYLNTIPYGSNVYGVETAAQSFFAKDASELTLGESAVLAAMLQRPSYYSPYGAHVEALMGRKDDYVLARMRKLGMITEDEYQAARAETITFAPYREEILAPHFVFFVREILEARYGKEVVEQGGLKVFTTLDSTMQDIANTAVAEQAEKNAKSYTANNLALVSMNTNNGDLLAMVGSKDFFNQEIDGQVNVVTASRQPGSSFKPFVYANAFLRGFGPGSVVYDVKTNFGNYEPENYDGRARGPVTLRYALGNSLNIPAVKVIHLGGVADTLTLANKMGIRTVDGTYADALGLSAALGVAEVRPIDMAVAFGAFSQGGYKVTPRAFLRIEDRYGKVLEEVPNWEPPTKLGEEIASVEGAPKEKISSFDEAPLNPRPATVEPVLDPQAAFLVTDILSDNSVKLSQNLILPNSRPVATKTGTANKKKNNVNVPSDTWTVGYTPSLVTVVWAGNTDGSSLNPYADGVNLAAPVWNRFMREVLADQPIEQFERPEGITSVATSTITGLIPSPSTPAGFIKTDLWPSFGIPKITDAAVVSAEVDSISGKLATEFTPEHARVTYVYIDHHSILYYTNPDDPQFARWEPPVRKWAQENLPGQLEPGAEIPPDYVPGEAVIDGKRYKYVTSLDAIPTEYDDIHDEGTTEGAPQVTLLSPSDGGKIAPGTNEVLFEVSGDQIDRVELYLDGTLQDVVTGGSFTRARIYIPEDITLGSTHYLVAYVYNFEEDRGVSEATVTISSDAKPPTLDLQTPRHNDRVDHGESVSFKAFVEDDKSGIREVEFILDGRPIKLMTTGPYEFVYTIPAELSAGEHTLTVRAFDQESNVARLDRTLRVTEEE